MQVANPFDFLGPPCPTRVRKFGCRRHVSYLQRSDDPARCQEASLAWLPYRWPERSQLTAASATRSASLAGGLLPVPGGSSEPATLIAWTSSTS